MSEAWQDAPKALVLVDFSAIAYSCWASAERAEAQGKLRWTEHISVCEFCMNGEKCPNPPPKQYDPHEVLKTNLRLKLMTLVEALSVSGIEALVMVLDSHCQWRYDIFPGYKGKRDPNRFNPRPEAEAYLREAYPNMKWFTAPGHEADDALATLVRINKGKVPIIVVTGDKDLWQLFDSPSVRIFNPVTQEFLGAEKVAEKFWGLDRQHIRALKALYGDSSDSLPNCAPRTQKQLVPLIREAGGDLMKTIELAKSRVNETCFGHLEKNLDQIVVNWMLAGLRDDVELM